MARKELSMIALSRTWYYLGLTIVCISFLAQFSSQQSTNGKEKPRINFFGTLLDQSNNSYKVENITIAGLYRQIPFYKIPPRKSMNPNTNITRFDLEEIQQIAVPYKTNGPQIHSFKNRDYIEVEITQNDTLKTKGIYIIEIAKKVYCEQESDTGPLQKELSFEAIDKIIFQGYKDRDDKKIIREIQ